jgi:hypothetical protein
MRKSLSIIAALAILTLAACPTEPKSKPKGPHFGEMLTISEQVYTRDFDTASSGIIKYTKFDKNIKLSISDNNWGGSGKIENGKISYSIEKPPSVVLAPVETVFSDMSGAYSDVNVVPKSTKAASLNLEILNHPLYRLLTRDEMGVEIIIMPPAIKISGEMESFMYVDNDVTITAQGSTSTEDIMGFPVNFTSRNLNLNLKKGWNTIRIKFTATINPMTEVAAGNMEVSLGDSSRLYWVVNSDYNAILPSYQHQFPATGR